jgi:hypothetical protein
MHLHPIYRFIYGEAWLYDMLSYKELNERVVIDMK